MHQHIQIDKTKPNTGVMDFSNLLDAPAGKHGFVEARDGHFYFEDGSRAKFFGFCISARSNTPTHTDAEKLATRLASMGVNVVRMHAADAPRGDDPTSWSSSAANPLLDYAGGTSTKFNDEGLDRFDYLFYQLKQHGIYVHIDLIVAREFQLADGLEFDTDGKPLPSCIKRYPMYNKRLIQLQKNYAHDLLTHKNKYTGLTLATDPAVMTVQINNEESAIKGTQESDGLDFIEPYRQEVRNQFGQFLLKKYGSRDNLAAAWTCDGVCALGDDEDPQAGTVQTLPGGFYQPNNDAMAAWDGSADFMNHTSVPRYADFMEFGLAKNKEFYTDMYKFLKDELGVRVPIATSNLVAGAADVCGHTWADVMEQDSYFNHPIFPLNTDGSYNVMGPTEYVSVNPLTMQQGVGAMGTSLLSLGAIAATKNKPMTLAEWNEYGLHPFHSTSFISTIAYACLNDWDALIVYNHHTSESMDNQPDDEILNVFDCYNDASLIMQYGILSSIFLKGLISPSKAAADIVYSQADLTTSPYMGYAPYTFLPYVMNTRNVFLQGSDTKYTGDADVAIGSGFLNTVDASSSKHAVNYAYSPYEDAFRQKLNATRLQKTITAADTQQIGEGAYLNKHDLTFDNIYALVSQGNYEKYAEYITLALQQWGVIDESSGYIGGMLVSDTHEIVTDANNLRFEVRASDDKVAYFSGKPAGSEKLGSLVEVKCKNDRITLGLLKLDAKNYLLCAIGATGTDNRTTAKGPEFMPGMNFTSVRMDGKIYADVLDGQIIVNNPNAKIEALDTTGSVLCELAGTTSGSCTSFPLDGSLATCMFHMSVG